LCVVDYSSAFNSDEAISFQQPMLMNDPQAGRDTNQFNGVLVIPAYNEAERLPSYLEALRDVGVLGGRGWRVCVVDDGSEPEELAETRRRIGSAGIAEGEDFVLLEGGVNHGKGWAVYRGWEEWAAEVNLLAFADADGAVPAREVLRLTRLAEQHSGKGIIASRVKLLGHQVERTWKRHLSGRIFATLVGLMIHPGIYDSQCGLKIIPSAGYRVVRPFLEEMRFAFDVELLACLLDVGVEMQEVPVDWTDIPGSKVRLLRDSMRMAIALRAIQQRRKVWRRKLMNEK